MSTVPALERGFAILELLNQHDAMSLEEITVATDFPRASVLRMLDTMCSLGVVCKLKENKKYRPLRILMPKVHGFQQHLREVLQQLAARADTCVEWYVQDEQGMRIADRFSAPENEVQVHARIGFMRPWYDELEAVAAVGLAHTDKCKAISADSKMWTYNEGGERRTLTMREIRAVLDAARENGLYCDPLYNSNGIKRIAAPVLIDGNLRGVVALALSFRPKLEKMLPDYLRRLSQAVKQLQQV